IPYTIFRSSLMFGEDDEFTVTMAKLVRQMLIVPIVGSGKTKFQMIWVEDTARCLAMVLEDDRTLGKTIPIGGPEHLSYEEIVDIIIQTLGARRLKVHVPLFVMRPMVWLMERFLSRPPITSGQLAMLALDNITELDAVERAFGFKPTPLREGIGYLR
ncbi:MAG: complex I NDUFA9 subunit family protein, partial [Chloroflexota bacterium]|nr:complex I NDUFA9 subunit family protein [Chloroflexota bacterium]